MLFAGSCFMQRGNSAAQFLIKESRRLLAQKIFAALPDALAINAAPRAPSTARALLFLRNTRQPQRTTPSSWSTH